MIDWHSHLLPEMDDGSRSVEESISMLDSLKAQGVSCVIATPHFLANEESVEDFLKRRDRSYKLLAQNMQSDHPRVLCGAEVKYYPGISKMKDLDRLAIEGTRILLLEMPMKRWTEYTFKELTALSATRRLTVVMAHIERYLAFHGTDMIERLCDNGLLMQVNASFFERFGSRRKALKLLQSGMIHFIGSDCHNLTTRAPRLEPAFELIGRKAGE
jgi:protein-tyrosine phosphatase